MSNKTSSQWQNTTNPVGVGLNYNLDYKYDAGYAHRAEQIGDMYYRYDGNGNLIEERFGGHAAVSGGAVNLENDGRLYSADYGFALTQEGAGKPESHIYERDFGWNERNLLIESHDNTHRVHYRYGADGQRAIKYAEGHNETIYMNKMWQMSDTTGDITKWRVSKHIFVGDARIATKRSVENEDNEAQERLSVYYYHSDHLGSAQLVTDYQGLEYERLEYTPYGELWIEQAANGVEKTPFRFSGKEMDTETGFYYYGARYLNPKTSMWISADPAMGEYVPGAPINDEAKKHNEKLPGMGGVFNYVNLHVYHYAGNNPVKYIDPDGRDIGRWFSRNWDNLLSLGLSIL
jgi:RHS repeat-associated protein